MNKVPHCLLVTGANGFVGHALCTELARREYVVRGAIRDRTRSNGLRCELAIVGDITPSMNWSAALDGVETVVHLAGRVHMLEDTAPNPLLAFLKTNTAGTENLAEQAAQAGVRRFVYLSSIKVNGEYTLLGEPFTELKVPAPIDPYAISKYDTEKILHAIAQRTTMEIVIIRPPLIYGPGVKANFLRMMHWLNKSVPLPFGAIHNLRSLVALDNLIDFTITCLEHHAAANQAFLISDGEDLSTTDLLRRMAKSLDIPINLLPFPQKLIETGFKIIGKRAVAQRLCASLQIDISKARTLLGWTPPIRVDEGLRQTAQWFLHEKVM